MPAEKGDGDERESFFTRSNVITFSPIVGSSAVPTSARSLSTSVRRTKRQLRRVGKSNHGP